MPEHLFQYPAAIVPKSFEGDITLKPVGTGAFNMKEYVPGERCRLTKREGYWRMGEDGNPLPYLDEIVLVQLGDDPAAWQTALKSGQVEMIVEPPVTVWEGVKDDPTFTIVSTATSATRTLRVRVSIRTRGRTTGCARRSSTATTARRSWPLRSATRASSATTATLRLPRAEYVPLDPYPFDTAKSMELLEEAGVTTPVKVEINVASDWPESMAYAQALKEDAVAGGFDISLKTMPSSQYWDGWTDFNIGITWWAHRPLATMLLPQAYTADKDGKPGAVERDPAGLTRSSRSCSTEAKGTLDLDKRKEIVANWKRSRRSAVPSARRSL